MTRATCNPTVIRCSCFPKKLTGSAISQVGRFIGRFSPTSLLRLRTNDFILRPSPIFIVGTPRSGSTALYQAMTAALDVSYINNLSCSLCNSLPLAFRISRLIFGGRAHRCYTSNFGNTRHCGWNAPAECGEFWYRWLPRGRHFINFNDITKQMVRQIRSEIVAATRIAGKPIVFKNLNAGQRLRLLSKVAPEARIIHITRDIRFNVRSIMTARDKNNVDAGYWWSIKPPNYEQYLDLPEVDLCVAQVKAITAQIEHDRSLFPPTQWKTVQYEDLTADPDSVLQDIAEFLGVDRRSNARWREMISAVGKPGGELINVEPDTWDAICSAVANPAIDDRVARNAVYD